MKLKMIFDTPQGAPYGTRPETHFIKFSNRCWREIEQVAESEGISLEETVHLLLKKGLNAASENKTKQSGSHARSSWIELCRFERGFHEQELCLSTW